MGKTIRHASLHPMTERALPELQRIFKKVISTMSHSHSTLSLLFAAVFSASSSSGGSE
jgi:hypothetical protein